MSPLSLKDQPRHIVVIGAGIIGSCTAHALLDQGHRVTLLEPLTPGGTQAASYGNGAFISPASIIPMSVPGLWRNVPGYLCDPLGPLTIRWQHLARLTPWLIRFVLAGRTKTKLRRTAAILSSLLHDAPSRHSALAAQIGQEDLIRHQGLLYAYPDRASFDRDALSWAVRRENGLSWQEIEGADLRSFEPALSPHYSFGIHVKSGAHCMDPGGWTNALAQAAQVRGAQLHQAQATGFRREGQDLRAVLTTKGEIPCDAAVVAAGIHSGPLAAALGDKIPMTSERGYHVELPGATGGPSTPTLPSDGKMGNTPLSAGLRASGQVELASVSAAPDWRRAEVLLNNLKKAWPALQYDPARLRRWMGHRPSPADGLPVIGPAKTCPSVIYAFGHGHTGLAAGPMTGALVAALVTRSAPPIDPSPFSSERFR